MADKEQQARSDTAQHEMAFHFQLPPPFTGDAAESFSLWVLRFEVALNVSSSNLDKAKLLLPRSSGSAVSYWQSLLPAIGIYEIIRLSRLSVCHAKYRDVTESRKIVN